MGAIVAASVHVGPTNPAVFGQFVRGFQHALLVAAGIAFTACLVAVTTVRKYRPAPEAAEIAA
jgi:hypothetical protein